jgi:hypothetical protein
VLRVLSVEPVLTEARVLWGLRVQPVLRVRKVLQEQLDFQVPLVQLDRLEQLALQDLREQRVQQVLLDLQPLRQI